MKHLNFQGQSRLVRLPEVTKLTGIARSTIYKWMAEESFPRPLQISIRHVAWREQDILNWIADLPTSLGSSRPYDKPEASNTQPTTKATSTK